ncbi:MAG: hypothetical protein NTY02_18775, partial [Acidobacteria bacterium]|nr:hypothetical protein [Acidobacteriota bacterium]
HFHYLLVENGGCISLAASMPEHLSQLAHALDAPAGNALQTRAFVERFVRPHGLERPATPILADAIVGLAAEGRRSPGRAPWWSGPLRVLVLSVSLVTGTVSRLSSARWRGRARKAVARSLEQARKRFRRAVTKRRK